MVTAYRDRIPALVLVALLHIVAVIAFLNALIIEREPQKRNAEEHETQITLAPAPPSRQIPRNRRLPATGGSNTIMAPYFNPYTFNVPPSTGAAGSGNGIALALAACDPGRYDVASREVRAVCDRIGLALKNDPGHFGVALDINDPKHWTRELARREAPHLMPCMKAHPPPAGTMQGSIVKVDLQTLLCVSRILFVGYDSEKHERYSQ